MASRPLRLIHVAIALLASGCADLLGVEDWGATTSAASASTGAAGGTGGIDGGASSSSAGGGPAYPAAVLADAPVAYWRLDEKSGTQLVDVVGGVAGTVQGDVTLGEPGGLLGDPDTAIAIADESGQVTFDDVFDFAGTAPFSIEAWVKPASVDTKYRRIVDKSDPTAGQRSGYLLFSSVDALAFERWQVGNLMPDHVQGSLPLVAGVFTHVVVTCDDGVMTLYVNAAKVGTSGVTVDLDDTKSALVLGSNRDGFNNLGGTLDEVAFYDHALAVHRIVAHFAAAKAAN